MLTQKTLYSMLLQRGHAQLFKLHTIERGAGAEQSGTNLQNRDSEQRNLTARSRTNFPPLRQRTLLLSSSSIRKIEIFDILQECSSTSYTCSHCTSTGAPRRSASPTAIRPMDVTTQDTLPPLTAALRALVHLQYMHTRESERKS
jgi:hypothetical protein